MNWDDPQGFASKIIPFEIVKDKFSLAEFYKYQNQD